MSILQKLETNRPQCKRWMLGMFLMYLFMIIPGIVNAQDRYVSTTGTNAGDCSNPGSPCLTISYAIGQAVSSDNIHVEAGTYNENVQINKSVNLLGAPGTIVVGSPGALGTFWINSNTNDVSINGFELIGYDSASPGIENAALYIRGTNNNITIENCIITADGEAALLTEYGYNSTNLVINNNTFNGKTFVGTYPADCGSANQFTVLNVPRQLIAIHPTASNVTFTNNTISGISGGEADPSAPCTEQGNVLVTIDSENNTISGNTFNGVTSRNNPMLRTRGTGNSISGNIFDGSNLFPGSYFHYYNPNALVGGTPDNIQDLIDANTFSPAFSYYIDASGNTQILLCLNPVTNLEIIADPNGNVCLGAQDIQYSLSYDYAGDPSALTFEWCAYNNETGSGPCFGDFSPSDDVENPTRSWGSTTGLKSVSVKITQLGCDSVTALYAFEVIDLPVRPIVASSSHDINENVCEGTEVWAEITPGTDGVGTCNDEIRYSVDNGANWYPYVSGSNLTVGTERVIIESRRVCDGYGCDGAASDFEEIIYWNALSTPKVSIDPIDNDVCRNTDVEIAYSVTDGSDTITLVWSGTGAAYYVDQYFNSPDYGSYNLILTATDENGCEGSDEITIHVRDLVRPTIICPADLFIDLPQGKCDTILTFEPIALDNCDGVSVHYSSTLGSESVFPIGVHTVSVYAQDDAGNYSDTCSFTVTVIDYLNPSLGCKPVQLSLGEDCADSILITQALTGWNNGGSEPDLGCPGAFSIDVTAPNGSSLGNYITGEYVGQTLEFAVYHVGRFLCHSTVTVEDKAAPTVVCRDTIVHCLTDLNTLELAYANDNCGAVVELVNEKIFNLPCDPDYVCKVERTFKAVDNSGNESELCTATIYLLRPSRDGIVAPKANDTLECSTNFKKDENGNPHPDVTGVPSFDGRQLWPQNELDLLYCNSLIDYKDDVVIATACKTRILRTWTITEWWCSSAVELLVAVQVIDILDTTPPVIPQEDGFTVTTRPLSCSAIVNLPQLNITDNCNEIKKVVINVTTDGQPNGVINNNGGSLDLEVGTHLITYTAIDQCLNQSDMSFEVVVRDNTDPVAICDQFNTVSIREDGQSFITAQSIDDGSYDACGDVTLKIRRMSDPCNTGQDLDWFDSVDFCCLDANTQPMIALLVTDKGGNTNICMVSVNVQDKINPTIACPADTIIRDCLFTFDPSESGANHAFGAPVITDNCPSNVLVFHELQDNRSQCGTGEVVRTMGVVLNGATTQTCTQTITFLNEEPFYINEYDSNDPFDDVVWPLDYTAVGQCSLDGLAPEGLPAEYGYPVITEDACDMVGVRYDDVVYPFTTNGACYKIIRTWTIIDWCQENRTWTFEQEIKVMDNDAPIFDNLPTEPIVFEIISCETRDITIGAEAHDCTPSDELQWTYVITKDGDYYGAGNGNVITSKFEVGDYNVEFTVGDRCGNLAKADYDFKVITTKPAVAVCIEGLSSSVVLMDTDGDGNGDTPQVMVNPGIFNNKSYHPCGYDFVMSFSNDVTDTLRTFTCEDLGEQPIELWVTDENGNTSYCATFIDIQDTDNICPPTGPLVSTISGRVIKEDNQPIEEVNVELVGVESDLTLTNDAGSYAFSNVRNNRNYNIIPGKDGDDINGVSTFDLVLIQRHILGLEPITSPYRLIAADVNNNQSITASDLTELRKLILGVYEALPNNSSWRFVDANHRFADPTDPWTSYVPETYNLSNLRNNMDINFIGLKVGDVNGDAIASKFDENQVQTRTSYSVAINDKKVYKGEIVRMPVIANQSGTLLGLQAQFQANGLVIRGVYGKALKVSSADYALFTDNNLKFALAIGEGIHVHTGQTMFEIEVEATKSGMLSEMLQLGNAMHSEMYSVENKITNFGINWRNVEIVEPVLSTISPNPWSVNTEITFDMPKDGMVTFKVKDYTGKKLITTIDHYQAGQNFIKLNRSDIPQSGVYFYEIRTENKIMTGKMIVIE